ncbi:MAG: hypothetical protein V9G20_26660 [Candidatus Promineifilaceae bacterium]
MFPHCRIHIILVPVLVALTAVVGLLGVLQPHIYAAPSAPLTQPDPPSLFDPLEQQLLRYGMFQGMVS